MSYVRSPDHLTRGLSKLLGQFQGSPKIRALLATYLKQIQAVEDLASQTIAVSSINGGSGIVLDRIGKILGRGRMGLVDSDYKFALRAQIRMNRSCGIQEDFIAVIMLSVDQNPAFTVECLTTGPGWAVVVLHGETTASVIQVLWYSIQQIKQAGVRLQFQYLLTSGIPAFEYGNISDVSSANTTTGFATTALNTGGMWQNVQAA